jgi:hypothetical protein
MGIGAEAEAEEGGHEGKGEAQGENRERTDGGKRKERDEIVLSARAAVSRDAIWSSKSHLHKIESTGLLSVLRGRSHR